MGPICFLLSLGIVFASFSPQLVSILFVEFLAVFRLPLVCRIAVSFSNKSAAFLSRFRSVDDKVLIRHKAAALLSYCMAWQGVGRL